jgi:hypothetical protein
MNIDNRISLGKIKKVLTPKIVAMALLITLVVSTVFYITLENNDKNEINIWYISEDNYDSLLSENLRAVEEYIAECGFDKLLVTKRHPDDRYFDAAMSTSAYYNCDIFIMREEKVESYAEAGMFLTLTNHGFNESDLLYFENNSIGVLIDQNYYLLINSKTEVDLQIIYDILEILIN